MSLFFKIGGFHLIVFIVLISMASIFLINLFILRERACAHVSASRGGAEGKGGRENPRQIAQNWGWSPK